MNDANNTAAALTLTDAARVAVAGDNTARFVLRSLESDAYEVGASVAVDFDGEVFTLDGGSFGKVRCFHKVGPEALRLGKAFRRHLDWRRRMIADGLGAHI